MTNTSQSVAERAVMKRNAHLEKRDQRKTKPKLIVIYDTDGNPLMEGWAPNLKSLVADLVTQGKSLAGADLSNGFLQGINLSGADLRMADLSGADLRMSTLERADFRGAKMIDIRMQGAKLDHSLLDGADLTNADLNGCTIPHSSFRGAKMHRTSLRNAGISSCLMSYVDAEQADFAKSRIRNTDFAHARLVRCGFEGADLKSSTPIAIRSLPDRTRSAVVVACTYDKDTRFSGTVPTMKSDYLLHRFCRFVAWGSATATVLGAASYAPDMVSPEMLQTVLGSGVGLVLTVSALSMLKEGVIDWFKERFGEKMIDLQMAVRQAAIATERYGRSKWNLVCAIGKARSLTPIRHALESVRKSSIVGGLDPVRKFLADGCETIICDRKHLALALDTIAINSQRNYTIDRDITLIRPKGSANSEAPSCLRFHKGGGVTAIWPNEKGLPGRRIHYDGNGTYVQGTPGQTEPTPTPEDVANRFERAVLEDNGLGHFAYPKDTHFPTAGRDGSILIYKESTRLLDNVGDQPAYIAPDDTAAWFRGQKRRPRPADHPLMESHPSPKTRVEGDEEPIEATAMPDAAMAP
jgi:hypothetical protein